MATIKDVAHHAQVSPGTVSNFLTGKRSVSSAARSRISRAIEELRYKPNIVARSLINRRSNSIGVVSTGINYHGPSSVLLGIVEQANQFGYSLLLRLLPAPAEGDVDAVINDLTSHQIDGLIWAVPEVGDNRARVRAGEIELSLPTIFLNCSPMPRGTVVAIDDRAGVALAVEHLIGCGRRVIGILAGPLDWWEAEERRASWQDTLERAGLDAHSSLMVEGDWSVASGDAGLRRLVERRPDVDAVFVSNDQMSLGALHAASHIGRRVPEELAVVGFGDIPESPFFLPPLTTVHQDLVQVGRTAMQELWRTIDSECQGLPDDDPAMTIRIKPELVIRKSSVIRTGV